MSRPAPDALRVAETARTIALQMMSERGRGAVLVGGARVDGALEALLKAALAPPSGPETLFLTDRPLGFVGARIALAQRLGLIDMQVELALHTLRRVRNAFATPRPRLLFRKPATTSLSPSASGRLAAIPSEIHWNASSTIS